MTNSQNAIIKAKLSIQRALLGMVQENLRAVVFSVNDDSLDVRCYFEGPIGEDELELISCVETEILADYEPEFTVLVREVLLNSSATIADDGVWVFHRKEGSCDQHN